MSECLVPCYSESLEIIRRTVMAAYDAVLPEVNPNHPNAKDPQIQFLDRRA